MRVFILLLCIFTLGCTNKVMEELKRGPRGSSGYIAPDYRKCKVVILEPDYYEKSGSRTIFRNAYTVIEDDRGRRYIKVGQIGELGDEFEMDVSLIEEVK